jgi:hypothetical protein
MLIHLEREGGTRCRQRVAKSIRLRRGIWIFENLSADQNQNARCERENSHYDRRNGNVEQQSDSGENQVAGEQEHSKIFCDHHGCFLI